MILPVSLTVAVSLFTEQSCLAGWYRERVHDGRFSGSKSGPQMRILYCSLILLPPLPLSLFLFHLLLLLLHDDTYNPDTNKRFMFPYYIWILCFFQWKGRLVMYLWMLTTVLCNLLLEKHKKKEKKKLQHAQTYH